MHAFVLDRNRKPLTPCRMARARILLKLGRAVVFRRYPFTIILKDRGNALAAREHRIKIDPGSKTTGLAIVQEATGRVIAAVEIEHRGQAIKLIFYSCAPVFDVSPLLMDQESYRSDIHSATSHCKLSLKSRFAAL